VRAAVPDDEKLLCIFTDVFDCIFRFLSPLLDREELLTPSFALSCLNRLQLKNNQQMVDLTDIAGSLQFAGTLDNPLVTEATA
jgi:siderophore synthetase component